MQLREFGRTGRQCTPFGLGMAALGRPGYINLGHSQDLSGNYDPAAMRQQAADVLQFAWDQGVRYFDAARSYGAAEEFLSSWLKQAEIAPSDCFVASKWGYAYTADWQVQADVHEEKQHTLQRLDTQWEETAGFLADHLDLYQIHSATLESGVLENTEVLNRLAELKAAGTLVGLSVSGPKQKDVIERAVQVEIDGVRLFNSVQATWNLLETSAGPALELAHHAGLGVVIKEAVANGRLTDRNQAPEFALTREVLLAAAKECDCTLDALALAAVSAQPWVDVVLSGAATQEHLQSNLAAAEVKIPDGLLGELLTLREQPADYWQTRSNLAWN